MSSRRALLVVMCAGYILVLLDVTIVNVALPSIRTGLGAGAAGLQWVVDGYAVALAALMPGCTRRPAWAPVSTRRPRSAAVALPRG